MPAPVTAATGAPPFTGTWAARISNWADDYKRILKLFEDNLRQGGTGKNGRTVTPVQ